MSDIAHLPLDDLAMLTRMAREKRDVVYGNLMTYSRKVFIPLTTLCRDVCHYCTFAKTPHEILSPYLPIEAVRKIALDGVAAGCKEALFTLGDKPELRYSAAREALAAAGCASTAEYLENAARVVLNETGLLPHLNPGVLDREQLARLRSVSASMGIMLESTSARLCERGGPHYGSPDKAPAVRLQMIDEAGQLGIPFTTGVLIGIGETRAERIDTIRAIADLHARHGHIQEVIVQNFRAKPGTRMAHTVEPDLDDLLWTIAVARLLLPEAVAVQAPPNLSPDALAPIIEAGINDWGGVSPVTPDHVNPEADWPELSRLAHETARAGKLLTERLTIYPTFARHAARWADPAVSPAVLELSDASGLARDDIDWRAGTSPAPPPSPLIVQTTRSGIDPILKQAEDECPLSRDQIVGLFAARGSAVAEICHLADVLRDKQVGSTVSYVVTRNINYTNICLHSCAFCAFSKGRGADSLRGKPYDLDLGEVGRRVLEAHLRGAVEVCMQGGIHPRYSGETYLSLLHAAKRAVPSMHVHAFSPLEVTQGARTLDLSLDTFLGRLRDAGLGSLPGTAAEILDDEVRSIICPDKISTSEWLNVMATAHSLGIRSTATIMFGHVDRYEHWANHLIALRDLQQRTSGFTEFVPLAFVAEQAPIYRAGKARPGPTWREAVLMHAVARLSLGAWIPNIQASWVKLGLAGATACLKAGANDLGGTLMNESITRSAGASHGEELGPQSMEAAIAALGGRSSRQRTTLYGDAPCEQRLRSFAAPALENVASLHLQRAAR